MLKKEEMIKLETGFAELHFRVLVMVLAYLALNGIKSLSIGTPVFQRGVIACAVLIAEQLLRAFDYFESGKVVFGLKICQLIIFSIFMMNSGYAFFEYIIYVILWFLIAMELGLFFDLTESNSLIIHTCIVVSILFCAGIGYTIVYQSFEYILTAMVAVAALGIAVHGTILYASSKFKEFEKAVFAKDRMIDKAMDANNEIIEKQEKLFYVNEQLGIKRIELESANHKINVNNMEINLQNDVLRFFTSTQDIHRISTYFSEQLVKKMGVKCAGILRADFEDGSSPFDDYKIGNPLYDSTWKYYIEGDLSVTQKSRLYECFTERSFVRDKLRSELFVCNNVRNDEYPLLSECGVGSFAAKVIEIDGKASGVYLICHWQADYFEDKRTYFENMLYQFQVAVNNAFLYTQFENMAKTDGLTGLFNRRNLNKVMEKYRIPTESVKKEKMVAAMFDIDNFKSINDKYGHLFGDRAIVMVSGTIKRIAMAGGGLGYRYGGEEFVVIFKDKELSEAMPIIEDIHRAIRETPVVSSEVSLYINTSAGVCAYPECCGQQNTIIDNADKAMYISKTTGKGKITVFAE